MQGKLQSTLLFIRKIRIKVVADMAWWCENAFPSLMQPAIQTSTAFTVNNRLTLTKMHHTYRYWKRAQFYKQLD